MEPAIYQPMIERYRRTFPVAIGQYITELDVNKEEANVGFGFGWKSVTS